MYVECWGASAGQHSRQRVNSFVSFVRACVACGWFCTWLGVALRRALPSGLSSSSISLLNIYGALNVVWILVRIFFGLSINTHSNRIFGVTHSFKCYFCASRFPPRPILKLETLWLWAFVAFKFSESTSAWQTEDAADLCGYRGLLSRQWVLVYHKDLVSARTEDL